MGSLLSEPSHLRRWVCTFYASVKTVVQQSLVAILEATTDFVGIAESDGRAVYLNAAGRKLIGMGDEDIRQTSIPDYLPGWANKIVSNEGLPTAARVGSWSGELALLRREGREIPVSMVILAHKGPHGEVECYSTLSRDISEFKRERKEHCSRTHLAELVADVCLTISSDDRPADQLRCCVQSLVYHLDAAFARIWTLTPNANLLELAASAGCYTHLDGSHSRIPLGAFKIGRIASERRPYLTNDVLNDPSIGEHDWAEREGMVAFAGYPLLVGDRLVGVVGVFARHELDESSLKALEAISNAVAVGTERRRNEQALRDAEARARAVFEAAGDGIIVIDESGKIDSVNPAVERIFGHTARDVVGGDVGRLMIEPQRSAHHGYVSRYLSSGEPHVIGKPTEVTALRRDGTTFPVELTVTDLRLQDRRCFLGVARDISLRKQAELALRQAHDELESRVRERTAELQCALATLGCQAEELKRSNRELQLFAYIASHDLQEPLRMVSSYTQLLARRYKGRLDADADEFIHFAVDGATRMQTLINDLLAYSRVGTSATPFASTPFASSVERAMVNLREAIRESEAQVTCEPLPELVCDPGQIVQVFQNLIGNAIKYRGQQPPRVQISAYLDGTEWHFTVSDNGIGIDSQYAERIFEIFQRLHTRAQYPGTGIGLAICRKIVDRHGGRIWVESRPGDGAAFHFTIPSSRPEMNADFRGGKSTDIRARSPADYQGLAPDAVSPYFPGRSLRRSDPRSVEAPPAAGLLGVLATIPFVTRPRAIILTRAP